MINEEKEKNRKQMQIVCIDDLVPQDRRRIAAGGGHSAVALIAHPAGAHIVGAVAHEVAVKH